MHNVHVVRYEKNIDFADLFSKLKSDFGAERLTIQSGGTLNTLLVREGLIDRVLLVVAPALIGGKETATLLDGESLHVKEDLKHIRALELVQATPLKDSYLLLEYVVK
jgi:2,5-diamino-6-(ribosylamino)-4(3H)-pyrimidinone 5'-phosphate reductase